MKYYINIMNHKSLYTTNRAYYYYINIFYINTFFLIIIPHVTSDACSC